MADQEELLQDVPRHARIAADDITAGDVAVGPGV
jgi:hypothetical protein